MSPYSVKPRAQPRPFIRVDRSAYDHHATTVYENLMTTCFDCGLATTVKLIAPCVHCGRETCPRCRKYNPEVSRTCCAIERNERQPKFVMQGA